MGIETHVRSLGVINRCDDGKFWCNFGAVKEGKRTEHVPVSDAREMV